MFQQCDRSKENSRDARRLDEKSPDSPPIDLRIRPLNVAMLHDGWRLADECKNVDRNLDVFLDRNVIAAFLPAFETREPPIVYDGRPLSIGTKSVASGCSFDLRSFGLKCANSRARE